MSREPDRLPEGLALPAVSRGPGVPRTGPRRPGFSPLAVFCLLDQEIGGASARDEIRETIVNTVSNRRLKEGLRERKGSLEG